MIADYKGVDFSQFVGRARIARNNEELWAVLEYLNEELERRKSAFVKHGCRNIAAVSYTHLNVVAASAVLETSHSRLSVKPSGILLSRYAWMPAPFLSLIHI